MPLVQIQIVTWNSKQHLERLFRGIEQQQGVDFSVLVIDNASSDGTLDLLIEKLQIPNSKFQIIKNKENLGFAKAHNQGFAMCEAPYVLVLNPDTELRAGYLTEMTRVIGSDNKIASVQGKLYRELPKEGKYGIIDSCGLQMKPWSQVIDIGQNMIDKGNFSVQTEVFGVTGACALYRLEALRQVTDKYGIFDERFGTYKEDVDLAWRLKRAGWKAVYTPKAACWHGRGVGKRDKKSMRIRYLSFRNHLLMVGKNLI